ncbi:MAG: UDP-N-acetylglucosamine 1-carboxyvinyltransferase [Planctomycetota bacterium]|nr:UDP-N-acetylglucosamine 1-carboxyvinyltransferase [Planctomycetota bacterium]
MQKLIIEGGNKLSGTIKVSGSKNASLPILAATLLADGKSVLTNVPDLSDMRTMVKILRELGVDIEKRGPGELACKVTTIEPSCASYELVSQMRASICVLGPLVARRGYAKVSLPGGCVIGLRPVDLHLKGLRALGAEIEMKHGYIEARSNGRLRGAHIYLGGVNGPSVLATANTLMAACLADGKTVIDGAACEPEIANLSNYLVAMGATIEGIGTPRIQITGVPSLKGANHEVIADRIEAGTFMVAAALAGEDVKVEGARLEHLSAFIDVLQQTGYIIDQDEDGLVRVIKDRPVTSVQATTMPYPGFPTDLQAQLVTLLTLADGMSVITERIFPDRFMHLAELSRLGANVQKIHSSAVIKGVKQLTGAQVMASDLRAGAALVLAGMVAQGTTEVHRIYHIDRGYEQIEEKLRGIGAQITRADA